MTDQHLEHKLNELIKKHGSKGRHRIHVVADHGDISLLNYILLQTPTSVVKKSEQGGCTALHYAAKRGSHPELCHRLLESALAPIEAKDKAGWTPLHYAAHNHQPETVKKLMGKGADVNARTSDTGETPLHVAAKSGLGGNQRGGKTVEALLSTKRTNTKVKNDNNKTAREIAEGKNRQGLVELIDKFNSA